MQNKFWKMLLISAMLLLFQVVTTARREPQDRILVINGQDGQAKVVELGGRSYVDLEELTQITHGSLSFNANRIILHIPTSTVSHPATEPAAGPSHSPASDAALSQDFMRAGIEEIATMREWASTLANAIQNGYPVTENWAANYREQAAHGLRLASAAASTEADRNALQLLTHEFDAVREWCNKLIQERQSMSTAKYALSPNTLLNEASSQKIVACGHFLASMLGSGSFQDGPSCH